MTAVGDLADFNSMAKSSTRRYIAYSHICGSSLLWEDGLKVSRKKNTYIITEKTSICSNNNTLYLLCAHMCELSAQTCIDYLNRFI